MQKFIVLLFFLLSGISSTVYSEVLNRGFAWPLKVGELDPHTTSSDTLLSLVSHYLEPLLRMNPDGEIVPGLAERWEVSDDSKLITLYLNKEALWASGTPITAQQVKQSIERALSGYGNSDAIPMLSPIQGAEQRIGGNADYPLGIEVPNEHEVRFQLVSGNLDFLKILAHPIASPVPVHQMTSDKRYPPLQDLDSSGPYRLVQREQHTALFVWNERYFKQMPYFKTVRFQFADYQHLVNDFLDKSLDMLEYLPAKQMPWLRKKMPEALHTVGVNGAFYLVALRENLGGVSDVLRSYLMQSIDVKRLNQIMTQGGFSVVGGLIPWEEQPLPNADGYLEQGRKQAEQLGYGADTPLTICIQMRKSAPNEIVFNYLKALWGAMHIQLVIEYFDNDEKGVTQPRKLCPMVFEGFGSRIRSAEELILAFVHQEGWFYPWLTGNPLLEQQYRALLVSHEPTERQQVVKELEKILLDQYLVKALYKTDFISLVHPNRVANYSQTQTNVFIPLSEYLRPPATE